MPKKKPNVLPPPSDRELALAEQRTVASQRARLSADDEEDHLTTLADAGEPEARELLKGRFKPGITAMASALKTEPLAPPKPRSQRKLKLIPDKPPPPSGPPPDSGGIIPRELPTGAALQTNAYALMDLYFRRWARDAKKDSTKATRELGIALGGDAVLFIRAGIVRFADSVDQIKKLIETGRRKSDPDDEEIGYDDQMAKLQKQMRGE